eukprot:SAG31_NODE_40443_length_280_cov_3.906077_1_plen_30_part_10
MEATVPLNHLTNLIADGCIVDTSAVVPSDE